MLIQEEKFYQKRNTFVSSIMRLDESYAMQELEPNARELLGANTVLPFDELGYTDEDKEELGSFLEGLKIGTEHRVIVRIFDRENRPRLVDIRGEYDEGESLPYKVTIWDLENLESDFTYFKELTWKYRVMIGLSGLTCFDYDPGEDIISFYHYVSRKSVRQFYGSFAEFKEAFINSCDTDDRNLSAAHKLLDQLEECHNSVETTVRGSFLSAEGKTRKLYIRAQYDTMNDHKRMYGVVTNLSDTEEDLPFYMTTAGLDSMTGLLNKRSLVEYTEAVLTNPATASRKHYMVILDMDDFKNINDNYGHQMGDKAITMLARTLTDVVKDEGIIGRYGGDEFYILTERTETEDDLRSLLRLIRHTAETRGNEELGIANIHLSMGVSMFPNDGSNFKDLMALADKALYIAKEKGKNRYIIYRPAMHENIIVGVDRRGLSSYDEQARVMNTAIREMFAGGKEALFENLPRIVKGFDLDSIDIFYGEDMKEHRFAGKYESGLDCHIFFDVKKYMSCFDDNGLYVLNNYNNLMRPIPQIYVYLKEKKCMSVIQLALPSAENPRFFISFNMQNRIHKWSEAEISSLGLLGTLADQLLNK